jgi:hypothetical protein
MTTATAYREPGLSRDAARLWSVETARMALVPANEPGRPAGPRCPACRYRIDAPGHRTACCPAASAPSAREKGRQ